MIAREVLAQLQSEVTKLSRDLEQTQIYIINEDGQLIVSSDGDTKEGVDKASILASWFSASKMLFESHQLKGFYELAQWGDDCGVYAFPLSSNRLLAVVYKTQFKFPGWVLMKCRNTLSQVESILNGIKSGEGKKQVFEQITDDEIDELFNGL